VSRVRAGVVGHVEWVDFAVVERIPAPGEILHADAAFADVGGGGGVAAVHMAALLGSSELFTAVGSDAHGASATTRLAEHGVTAHAAVHPRAQRRSFTHLTADHERAITVLGPRLVPHGADPIAWERVAELDAVYLTAGDADAIRAARAARLVVATPRAAPDLLEAAIALDAVVLSAADAHEQGVVERLDPAPALVVRTAGAAGGSWSTADGRAGMWAPAPPPGPAVDSFGCGDGFAAGLTVALGAGLDVAAALAYAARVGAMVLTGRGPYGASLASIGPPDAGGAAR
jgi:ribokinase